MLACVALADEVCSSRRRRLAVDVAELMKLMLPRMLVTSPLLPALPMSDETSLELSTTGATVTPVQLTAKPPALLMPKTQTVTLPEGSSEVETPETELSFWSKTEKAFGPCAAASACTAATGLDALG